MQHSLSKILNTANEEVAHENLKIESIKQISMGNVIGHIEIEYMS